MNLGVSFWLGGIGCSYPPIAPNLSLQGFAPLPDPSHMGPKMGLSVAREVPVTPFLQREKGGETRGASSFAEAAESEGGTQMW